MKIVFGSQMGKSRPMILIQTRPNNVKVHRNAQQNRQLCSADQIHPLQTPSCGSVMELKPPHGQSLNFSVMNNRLEAHPGE